MNIANWISYLALFGPFFALIFFNSVIAYQLHSAFDASGPILGLIAEAPGFLGAAFWLLLAERVNVADRVYTSIERLQHPLDYVLGADGYSSAKWKRFVSAPATKFAMLDLPGEQENSSEFCKPRHGVALAFLDTFFLCLPAQTDFEIEVDYAAEANNAWLTISDGADELMCDFFLRLGKLGRSFDAGAVISTHAPQKPSISSKCLSSWSAVTFSASSARSSVSATISIFSLFKMDDICRGSDV